MESWVSPGRSPSLGPAWPLSRDPAYTLCQSAPDTKAELFSPSVEAQLGFRALDPVPASGLMAAEARLGMSMIPPFRFCCLRSPNGPKIVATQPFFDLPPPLAAAAGDMGDSAVPIVLALPAQASSDQAREPWEIRDGPKVEKQESGRGSRGNLEGPGV